MSSGSLRLIRHARVRTWLLDLYATYARISFFEDHMARDAEVLLGNLAVQNGFRLVVANLEYESGGLLKELETAQSQVEALLQIIPTN